MKWHQVLNLYASFMKCTNDPCDLGPADVERFSDFGSRGGTYDMDLTVLFSSCTADLGRVSAHYPGSAFRYFLHFALAAPPRFISTESAAHSPVCNLPR